MMYLFQNPDLPLQERVKDLISQLTVEEKAGFIPTRNQAVERLGIPAWSIGAEGAHGFVNREGHNTTFPQTIGLAASWDRDLLRRIGEVAATEARCHCKANGGKGGLSLWSPTIDPERDPRWGRTEEGYGEDPYLTSELSCWYIRGAQGNDPFYLRVSCGPKHFLANNNEKNRGSCSCSIPPRLLHEYYLVPFKAAVEKAHAVSIMTAYNEVNGIPMMMHPLLRDTVKKQWGLEGHIVTDGGDFIQNVKLHHYFETNAQTLAAALKNGADSMTDLVDEIIPAVKEALEKKLIDESELDEHLERIFSVRFRLGHFDPPECCPYDAIGEADLMKDGYRTLSLEAVRKSAVLLKNEGAILPLLPEKTDTIAVMGPLANELRFDWYTSIPAYTVTPLDGLVEIYGDHVTYTDCRDIVSFSTEDGKPMVLVDKVFTPGEKGEKPARFYMEDWGWGAHTFADVDSGLLLESSLARREAGVFFDESQATVTASAKNNYKWFVTTLFNIVPQEDGVILLRTFDSRRVIAGEAGSPVTLHDDPLPAEGELFRMRIERDGLAAAEEAAAGAQQVIFFAGSDPMINGREEVDRPCMNLPPRQEALINNVSEINSRTVVVMLSGYPYTIKEITKKIPAILWMAHGIQETGHGIADIISGRYSPAGKLPLTWYEDEKQLPDIMEYDIAAAGTTYQYFSGKTLWPFGHGLSYSSFTYSDLRIDKTEAGENDTLIISFKLTNSGHTAAEEVPQMYVTLSGASERRRPLKTLKGFDRLLLKPGESESIAFTLPVCNLSLWENFSGRFFLEEGRCTISVGPSSADIRLSDSFNIIGEKPFPRKISGSIYAERFDDYANCFLHEKRGSDIAAVFNKTDGGWIRFSSMDFAEGFSRLKVITQGGYSSRIELRLDSPDGELAGSVDIPNSGDISFYPLPKDSYRRLPVWTFVESRTEMITGIHDVYLVMYGKTGLWRFEF
ncbi:MAG: glycoside hydrolase family 3 C-terminal domain-containing protein [Treponema sp.]|jgi:beta-glucosidase|nr:glycoside hydrolase family 3 C-terminal domain-containing protein [Treponema sp.]